MHLLSFFSKKTPRETPVWLIQDTVVIDMYKPEDICIVFAGASPVTYGHSAWCLLLKLESPAEHTSNPIKITCVENHAL